jgi:hypothetical protein
MPDKHPGETLDAYAARYNAWYVAAGGSLPTYSNKARFADTSRDPPVGPS